MVTAFLPNLWALAACGNAPELSGESENELSFFIDFPIVQQLQDYISTVQGVEGRVPIGVIQEDSNTQCLGVTFTLSQLLHHLTAFSYRIWATGTNSLLYK